MGFDHCLEDDYYLDVLNDGSDRINGDPINGLFHLLINVFFVGVLTD